MNNLQFFEKFTLSSLLRGIGSILIILAALNLLLSNWLGVDHNLRYLLFLSFTAAATGLGFVFGSFNDKISARLMFGIGLILVPVNFLQLGALIYSKFQSILPMYGEIAHKNLLYWNSSSSLMLSLILAFAIPVLYLISTVAIRVFLREKALLVSSVFGVLNLLLLVPVRAELQVLGLIFIMLIVIAFFANRIASNDFKFQTKEALFLHIALLSLPLLALIRYYALYTTTVTVLGVCAMIFFVGFIIFSLLPAETEKTKTSYQVNGAWIMGFAWFTYFLSEALNKGHDFYYSYLIFLPIALFSVILSSFSTTAARDSLQATALRNAIYPVAYVLFCSLFFKLEWSSNFMFFNIIIPCLVLLSSAVATYQLKLENTFKFTIIVIALFIVSNLKDIFVMHGNPWIVLSIIGVITIYISSQIEKRESGLGYLFGKIKQNFSKNA